MSDRPSLREASASKNILISPLTNFEAVSENEAPLKYNEGDSKIEVASHFFLFAKALLTDYEH